MTGLLNAAQSGFTVGSFQFDLYVFTDTYIFNTFETNMFKSVLHGFALRIQDCFLGSDNNFSFHIQKRALFPGPATVLSIPQTGPVSNQYSPSWNPRYRY